jgi:hypothetical protein
MSILMFHKVSANNDYLNKLIKKELPNEGFFYKQYSFLNAFKRAIYINQESDTNSFNLYNDIKTNKLKKEYLIHSYYFYLLVNILYRSKIKNTKIKFSFFKKKIVNLNIFTKFIVRLCLCWRISLKLSIDKSSKEKIIFFNSKNKFTKEIYEKNLSKYFKNYKLISMETDLNLFQKFLIFFRNFRICFFNSYPTNNYHILVLFMKYDIFSHLMSNFNPKKGIFFEGDSPDDDLMSGYLRSRKIKTYLFQQGTYFEKQVPVFLRNLNYNYLFCWGDFFKNKIIKYNRLLKIFPVGRVGRNYENTRKKNIIIFADQNNPPSKKMLDLKNKFYELCEWCIKNLPNYKIILKPHPRFDINDRALRLKKYKNFVLGKKSTDVTNYLNDAKFLVSISSTTLIDALSYKVIPICFMSKSSMQPNLKENKLGIVINSLNSIKKINLNNYKNNILFKKILYSNKSEYYIKHNFDQNFKKIIKKKII